MGDSSAAAPRTQPLLEAKANLQRMLVALPLTDDERAAVDDGQAALGKLLERLAEIPTPAGPTAPPARQPRYGTADLADPPWPAALTAGTIPERMPFMIRNAAVYLLNKLVMEPSGWEPFTAGYDLDGEEWIAGVPVGAGVYLLYTPGHFFTLPGGSTSVLYIGKGSSTSVLYIGKGTSREGLRRRLREHRRFTRETRDGTYDRVYARYEWMAAHPARAAYAAAPDAASDPADMEHRLLLTFADAFRVAPLGNAQSAWDEETEE